MYIMFHSWIKKEDFMGDLNSILNSHVTLLVVMLAGFYWLGKKIGK